MSDRFVYLIDGTKCRVVNPYDGSGLIVYTQVSGVDPYGCGGSEHVVDDVLLLVQPGEVFDNPPAKVIDEQIKLKQLELGELTTRLLSMELQELEAELQYKALMHRCANFSSKLSRLCEFVDGKITHFLLFDDYGQPRIVSVEDLMSVGYNAKWGKVLSLTVTKWPNLTWTLDGASTRGECVPCVSYTDARKAGQRWVDEQIVTGVYRRHIILFANDYDLLVPADYIKVVVNLERQELDECEAKDREAATRVRLAKEHEWEEFY